MKAPVRKKIRHIEIILRNIVLVKNLLDVDLISYHWTLSQNHEPWITPLSSRSTRWWTAWNPRPWS